MAYPEWELYGVHTPAEPSEYFELCVLHNNTVQVLLPLIKSYIFQMTP